VTTSETTFRPDRVPARGTSYVVPVMEKALPSGSRKANIAGIPGQRRISSVSTPALEITAWASSTSSVVKRIPMAPRTVPVRAGSRAMMTLSPPGASSIQRPPLGVVLWRRILKPSVSIYQAGAASWSSTGMLTVRTPVITFILHFRTRASPVW
jgi:hypothetical protein